MTNPTTVDRRDVAHPTNPVGGQGHIEQIDKPNLSEPVAPDAAKLPAGGADAALTGMPTSSRDDLPDMGLPRNVPPARTGQSAEDVQSAEPPQTNPGRMDEIRAEGRDTVHVQSPRPAE